MSKMFPNITEAFLSSHFRLTCSGCALTAPSFLLASAQADVSGHCWKWFLMSASWILLLKCCTLIHSWVTLCEVMSEDYCEKRLSYNVIACIHYSSVFTTAVATRMILLDTQCLMYLNNLQIWGINHAAAAIWPWTRRAFLMSQDKGM